MQTSAARDTRVLCPPVTLTTGVWPRGPQVRPWAALSPGLIRPRSRARRPGPPPSFHHRPGLLPPRGDPSLIAFGGLTGRDLHTPADPVQQQINPSQRVALPEPGPDHLRDPGQRPALIIPPGTRPTRRPAPCPARAAAQRSACTSPRPRLWRPAPYGHQQPAPAATGSPTSATPGTAGHLPVTGPGLDQLCRR